MKLVARLVPLALVSSLAAQYKLHTDLSVPSVPQTGKEELYTLAIPDPPSAVMPMIVVFHGMSPENHNRVVTVSEDQSNGWDLLTDAATAGFVVLMPRGGNPTDYPYSQYVLTYGRRIMHYHVKAAIDDVPSRLPPGSSIDPDRIYGYGFSMGGDDALSFAARHLDPTDTMLAGVVTHSGAVSPPYTYHNGSANWQDILEGIYGATTYADDELMFQEATVVDYLAGTLPEPTTSMAWNLTHIPVACYYDGDGDNNPPYDEDDASTIAQNELLTDMMDLYVDHPDYLVANTDGDGHAYTSLATASILAGFTEPLELPTKGRILVAEPLDGGAERMFHFKVWRRAPPPMTQPLMASFDWDTNHVAGPIQPFPPRLDLHDLDGVDTIRGLTRKLGYATGTRLDIDVTIADAQAIVLEMTGYTTPPTFVYGNGNLLNQGSDWYMNGSILTINVGVDMLIEVHP